jgi:hypothetical protein
MADLLNFISEKSVSYRTEPFVQFIAKLYYVEQVVKWLSDGKYTIDYVERDLFDKLVNVDRTLYNFRSVLGSFFQLVKNHCIFMKGIDTTDKNHAVETKIKIEEYSDEVAKAYLQLQDLYKPIHEFVVKYLVPHVAFQGWHRCLLPLQSSAMILTDSQFSFPRSFCLEWCKFYVYCVLGTNEDFFKI